jgi:hypothetical protein
MKEYIKEFINNVLLKNGISVMIPENEASNYAFFFIGPQMLYFQEDYFNGQIRFSTVHKPCKKYGTGFSLSNPYEGPAIETVDIQYLSNLPKLYSQIWKNKKVEKYSSFNDYLNSPTNQILKYKILEGNNNFLINFEGRSNKAIGKFYNFKRTVNAADANKAILKLYNSFEHIRVNSISQLT